MTRAEIIALQQSLNRQGFDLVVDGRYGQKTREAYAEYLDRDAAVPTVVPPAPKPWWTSKTAIASIATILASMSSLVGLEIDGLQLTETLFAATTLVTGLLALWANARRDAPLDRTLLLPGVRLAARADKVPPHGQPDREPGPFGY